MSEATTGRQVDARREAGAWDSFLFGPASPTRIRAIRGLLCVITVAYFASCWTDAAFWYSDGGPLSASRVSSFLRTSGVEDAARWIISPLFLTDAIWVYRCYLAAGIVTAVVVIFGWGGQTACWILWLLLVGWANRAMILSGLTETLLSLGLFAVAIAPAGRSWPRRVAAPDPSESRDWKAGLAERLIAIQVTLIGAATFVTMLGGRVWFNGVGAYALAAPVENRTIDWTDTPLLRPLWHESLTHLMMIALPLGLIFAWLQKTHRIGLGLLMTWCLAVALLGSHWLYAMVMAAMFLAIRPEGSAGSGRKGVRPQ